MAKKTKLEELQNVRDIQGYSGNWDWSPYMLGMYNGIELALAIMEDREPEYKNTPKQFREDKSKEPNKQSWLNNAWDKFRSSR